jgi:hypothetical protein
LTSVDKGGTGNDERGRGAEEFGMGEKRGREGMASGPRTARLTSADKGERGRKMMRGQVRKKRRP